MVRAEEQLDAIVAGSVMWMEDEDRSAVIGGLQEAAGIEGAARAAAGDTISMEDFRSEIGAPRATPERT